MKYYAFIFLFLGNILIARACDCIMLPVKQQIRSTHYIIQGEVIEILNKNTNDAREHRQTAQILTRSDTTRYGYTVKIQVNNNYKGQFKAGDIIEINSTYSDCELIFELHKRYALFLHQENKSLFTIPCSYSTLLSKNKETRRLLKTIRVETSTERS